MRKFLCFLIMLAVTLGAFSACSSKPYDYNLENYITLPDWLKLTASDDEIEARLQEDINTLIKNNVSENATTARAAIEGDKVNVSFLCYIASDYGKDGAEPIDKLSDSSCTLILGDLKYPAEFEASIFGHFVNDKFSARLTLPESYGLSEYASANVVYDITLNSITELAYPELSDEFIKSVSEYQTVDEYKSANYEATRRELLFEKILALSEIKSYPEREVSSYERNYVSYYTSAAAEAGYTLEQYVNKKFFMSLAEFHSKGSAYAKEMVKKDLFLYQFVRTYGLEPTSDEYNSGAEKYAQMYGFKSVSALEAKFGEEFVRKSVAYDKALDYIGLIIPSTPKDNEAPST